MADKANIVVYKDDATTMMTLKPSNSVSNGANREEIWKESSNTVPSVLRSVITYGSQVLKDGTERRMIKVTIPTAESFAGADPNGYMPDAKANYILAPYIVIPVPPLASDTDVANALKLLINSIIDDQTAGTANAFRDATGQGREFLVHGFMPD